MKIPKEYIIKKSDAELGATNSFGYSKRVIGKEPVFGIHHDLISLINGHKPATLKPVKFHQRAEFIEKHGKLLEYIKNIKIYSINAPALANGDLTQQILWINPEYEKKSVLLRLFYYKNMVCHSMYAKKIKEELDIEIDKLLNSLDLSKSTKGFYYDCITGILLGYRPASIRGYYSWGKIRKHLKFNSDDGYREFKELDKKIIKEKYDKARAQYIKTPDYQVFVKEYPILKKKCDEWIEYMINDSKMFKSYYKECKKEITLLKI